MKKLNSSYLEFFFFGFGIIIIIALLVSVPILFSLEKDYLLLICVIAFPFVFFIPVCYLDYRSLEKNIKPANVFLDNNSLIINEISYASEQIKQIALMPVRNTLDKSSVNYIEITTNDEDVFYFIDKRSNWKFESPTMRLLNKHPAFASKTSEKAESSAGFKAFQKQKTV